MPYRVDLNAIGKEQVSFDFKIDDTFFSALEQAIVKEGEASTEHDASVDAVVAEKDGSLDLAPLIYDFIALAIPIQHMHAEGECDVEMMNKLNSYMVY